MDNLEVISSTEEFLIFKTQEQEKGISVRYENENLWMTQKAMAELFDVQRPAVTKHLTNIFNEKELDKETVCSKMEHTAEDGKIYNTDYYSLDAIISVGYRINSHRATQFRRWATQVLKKYTIEGYALDKKRMENGSFLNNDYFEKLLEEIREIRLSERRFYQKITDIYATSIDYDTKAPTTIDFFRKVQNKMHYAITHQTAAEIIYNRADHTKQNMNLTSWKNSPNGKILESDVVIAKNYLTKEEIRDLERIVNAFLELAERRAERHIPMTMEDWSARIDKYLLADDLDILKNAGKISHDIAIDKALSEFEKYRVIQDRLYESDFDKFVLEGSGESS